MNSLKIYLKLLCIPLLLTLISSANAEQVAAYIFRIDKIQALEVLLSDQGKGLTEKGLGECQAKGKRMVLIRKISNIEYPPITFFAQGCWHVKGEKVYIDAATFQKTQPINFTFSLSDFTKLNGFKTWKEYERYEPMTEAQSLQRDQIIERNNQLARKIERQKILIDDIQDRVSCTQEPFKNIAFVEDLINQELIKSKNHGNTNLRIHEAENGVLVFGKKLLSISTSDGLGFSKFHEPTYNPSYTHPAQHFAVTLDELPEEGIMYSRRYSGKPYKSKMQFIREGGLDGGNTGVTISCGFLHAEKK